MPETNWRDYLQGNYKIETQNGKYKMHYEIRERAKKLMKDLLLICKELPFDDRVQIFFDPDFREKVAVPLSAELKNNITILSPERDYSNRIAAITKGLEVYGIPYDLVTLVKNGRYESQMRVDLYTCLVREHGEEKANQMLKLFKLTKADIPKGKPRMKKYREFERLKR